ncbi:MAG: hypothetical protein OXE44_04375 [Nitrospinae bacterium]|nr:hypothetical protein [Nitrospinota bacterium]
MALLAGTFVGLYTVILPALAALILTRWVLGMSYTTPLFTVGNYFLGVIALLIIQILEDIESLDERIDDLERKQP